MNKPQTSSTLTFAETRLHGMYSQLGRAVFVLVLLACLLFVGTIYLLELPTALQNSDATSNISYWEQLGLSSAFSIGINLLVNNLILLISFAGAIFLVSRRSDDWLVLYIGTILLLLGITLSSLDTWTSNPEHLSWIWWLEQITFAISLPLIFFIPDGKLIPRWSWLIIVYYFIVSWVLFPLKIIQFGTLPGEILDNLPWLVGIGAQVYRYRHHTTLEQRQQLKWLFFGIIITVLPRVMYSLIKLAAPLESPPTLWLIYLAVGDLGNRLAIMAFPITLIFTILRYRLWDIDVVINRSIVYGSVAIMVLAFFFGILAALQILIGQTQPLVAFIVAAAFSVVAFNPVRNRVQNLVDRHLYGFRFDLNELKRAQETYSITNPGKLTGQLIDGYEVLGLIGQGGMGEVYQAVCDGQTVAIKTLLNKFAVDKNLHTRFQREAQTGMQLDHPNIAKVFASGIIDSSPYIIMDYIEGQDLRDILKIEETISLQKAIAIMKDICAALELAHQQGLVHRDIKPGNIMIRPDGSAVLMDFGVSKISDATSDLTGTGAIGTIDYMAPEQIASSNKADHRADIYALGIVLYEMLTGEKPFKGSAAQVMFAHIQQPPPYARKINPKIPEHIAEAIEKAMAKNPDDRFESAGAFAEAMN